MIHVSEIIPKIRALGHRLSLLRDIRRDDGRLTSQYESVTIELTSICNLSCPLCPVAHNNPTVVRKVPQMRMEDFRRILELTAPITDSFVLSMWGEAVLHKQFFDFLDLAHATGKRLWISTNLNYADWVAERLSGYERLEVICSMDGWDEQSYKAYRVGGRFDVMMRNMRILSRGKCKVWPQYLVPRDQPGSAETFCAFIDREFGIPRRQILLNPMNYNFKNENVGHVDGTCHFMYTSLIFNSDGYLQPCCLNVGKDLFIAHVSEFETSADLLNGEKLVDMRRRLAADKDQFPSCVSCEGKDLPAETFGKIKAGIRSLLPN
ncbi:MAG TPA: radical SAM protein [Candidatus Cybelea sp.]|nr:radical SAM protein [Candidatus Cybelea sp.]